MGSPGGRPWVGALRLSRRLAGGGSEPLPRARLLARVGAAEGRRAPIDTRAVSRERRCVPVEEPGWVGGSAPARRPRQAQRRTRRNASAGESASAASRFRRRSGKEDFESVCCRLPPGSARTKSSRSTCLSIGVLDHEEVEQARRRWHRRKEGLDGGPDRWASSPGAEYRSSTRLRLWTPRRGDFSTMVWLPGALGANRGRHGASLSVMADGPTALVAAAVVHEQALQQEIERERRTLPRWAFRRRRKLRLALDRSRSRERQAVRDLGGDPKAEKRPDG